MKSPTVKIAYRNDGTWQTKTYNTADPQWREAFLLLHQRFQFVRIIYN